MARFDNTVKGIGRLLKRLKEQDATVVVCEVTDGYERPLVNPSEEDPRLRCTWCRCPKEYVRISVPAILSGLSPNTTQALVWHRSAQ